MISFSLPYPPAVNNLFPTGGHGKRVPSKAYKAWRAEAQWMIPGSAKGKVPAHFDVVLSYDRPDRRKRDLDGLAKAPLDLLKTMGVIVDDSLAEDVRIRWASPWSAPVYVAKPQVHITIQSLTAGALT